MNERIKGLATQAAKEYHATTKPATHTIPGSKVEEIIENAKEAEIAIIPDAFCEKFAELLIQECAEVADNADATREKWQSIGKFVKEHFGVEE